MLEVKQLPTLNACLNFLSTIFLILGWIAIKKNNPIRHQKLMIAALCSSTLFLISYLTYHFMVPGVTRYQNDGILRVIYFTILGTHTPLAAIIVPFCIAAVYFAIKGNFKAHINITRWLMPTWIYVSVTGVLIYLMLYVL